MPPPAPGRISTGHQSGYPNYSFEIKTGFRRRGYLLLPLFIQIAMERGFISMTHKLFICLANSKKYTQRCIAGIELAKSSRPGFKYDIVRHGERPVWLRPVTDSEHGEIPADLVDHINLLDIVEVEVVAPRPQGYKS